MFKNDISSGQIRYVNFKGDVALQGGFRPALIVQNKIGCIFSPRVWVIPLTTKTEKAKHLPMHILVKKSKINKLKSDSILLVEQAQFVLKSDIEELVGYMEEEYIWKCGNAWINNCEMFSPDIINALRTDEELMAI